VPTKRTFDLIILTGLFLHAALALPRLAARRWINESNGVMGVIGQAIGVGQ
jgi:hypothetical protein